MSGNPYPSPNSSSTSSGLPDVPEGPFEYTEEPMDRNTAATDAQDALHNSLNQASDRIRYLRRDLLHLRQEQERIRNGLGPGHEAIVLTGQQDRGYLDELERIIPPNTRERLREFEARRVDADRERARNRDRFRAAAAAHMHPLDTSISPTSSHPSSAQSPLSFASPRSPPRQRLLPHRNLLDSAIQPLRRRDTTSDDPHTELGRRVAARESARTAAHSSPQTSSRDSPHRLPTNLPLHRRPEQPSLEYIREVQNRISRSLDNTDSPQPSSMESAYLRRIRTSQSRQGSNPSTNLPSATSSQSRLSLLSNFGMQNLPTPSSTISNPPLLFEEPTSYAVSQMDERMQSIEYDEQIRALLGARISQTRRMGWEGRADEDLLFTSSPVQMHHEPDVTRVGHHHHRENTVQMQEFSTASRSPLFDANGDEIQTGDVQELADSLLGLYSDALPPTHRQETSEIPIRSRAHDSNAVSFPTHQGDSGDRTHSPGGASHEPK
ncbi:hypothetical protein BT96DRAFT_985059 [Gymnopus androsaceus JB14]|uniref:Uncharacterized protein n=1 Tax=Gymnopus androsaceus JB14 TaxID=1447944 RepID=A0A6A4II33_9AGAR|nr:hypothetical protein BT96DRAFT_985059 [Gymnopus androsaceus JB14]